MSDIHVSSGGDLVPAWDEFYRDLHRHPELSFSEHRTAGIVAERLRALGLQVAGGIGRTGVVGVLRNGDGPDRAVARRHGRIAGRGGHRPSVRQHRPRYGPGRPGCPGHARLRPRHARHLPAGCGHCARRRQVVLVGDADGGLPTGRGVGGRCPRDGRGWVVRPVRAAGCRAGPARRSVRRRHGGGARRAVVRGGRRPAGGDVRQGWPRVAPGGDGGSHRDGGGDGDAPADRRLPRSGRHRDGRADGRLAACRREGQRDP